MSRLKLFLIKDAWGLSLDLLDNILAELMKGLDFDSAYPDPSRQIGRRFLRE